MRIAVSDYDGTMYRDGKLLGDVVGAVERWRRRGDRFGIATGRDYSMIAAEIERWGIPVDFTICINGAAIYDGAGAMLSRRFIPDDQIPVILAHPAAQASLHYQLSGDGPLHVALRPGSWFPETDIKYIEVGCEEATGMRQLGQISLAFESDEECLEWEARLRRDLGDVIDPHRNWTTIDMNAVGVDKASGIGHLVRLKGWTDAQIYTIGDGGNDLGMIAKYFGHTVPDAQDDVTRAARRVCADVADMLDNA